MGDTTDDEFDTVPDDFDQFDATLPLDDPITHYHQLIKERVRVNAFVPTEMGFDIWDKISEGARVAVWKLLFAEENPPKDRIELAAQMLREHRDDACFHSPSNYNDWIIGVRDELLKRNMLDFWKNIIVAEELGPAWARDSDLYDDMYDPEPANFYNYAGCKAAWLTAEEEKKKEKEEAATQQAINDLTLNEKESEKTETKGTNLDVETPLENCMFHKGT